MPQFILCQKSTCPLVSECYRFRASPEPDQIYNSFINICNDLDEFHFFISIRESDKVLEMEDILKNINLPENKCLEMGVYKA